MEAIFRVDCRLVHGQTINYWCTKYDISRIIVANDELANDDFKQLFMKITIENKMILEFSTIKDLVDLEYDDFSNYMVIFENIDDVVRYVNNNGKINNLIISNLNYGEEKVKLAEGAFLDKKDIEQIKFLKENFDVNVTYKTIPN